MVITLCSYLSLKVEEVYNTGISHHNNWFIIQIDKDMTLF